MTDRAPIVLVGGAGVVGRAVTDYLLASGASVVVVDARPPKRDDVAFHQVDLLVDPVSLPGGHVVVLIDDGNLAPRRPWTLALNGPLATARLLPALAGRAVTLLSSTDVYGRAGGRLTEATQPEFDADDAAIAAWCEEAALVARYPCPPWRAASLCRRLADAAPNPRWVRGVANLAQERLLSCALELRSLTVLRLAHVFGPGQESVIAQLTRRALAGRTLVAPWDTWQSFLPVADLARLLLLRLDHGIYNVGHAPVSMDWLATEICRLCGSDAAVDLRPSAMDDGAGHLDTGRLRAAGFSLRPLEEALEEYVNVLRQRARPLFDPPIPVVIPPRPENPELVADRQQASLWSGQLKYGARWTRMLEQLLGEHLQLSGENLILATGSGTDALRLALAGTAGPGRAGDVALLPSFTFPATVEVVLQLGYEPRFVDVSAETWTLDPDAVAAALGAEVRAVVCVDTFGNPCDYPRLRSVCAAAGVPLIADSAASLGSALAGRPVGTQADAHAYSMSFAKVLSAGGAGGAVVFAKRPHLDPAANWTRSALMSELHAVAALDQLGALDELVMRRSAIAAIYSDASRRLDRVVPQHVAPAAQPSWVHWVSRIVGDGRRARVQAELQELGVTTRTYFEAQHTHGPFTSPDVLPVTEQLDDEVLALPMSSEMTVDDAERVVAALEMVVAPAHARDELRVASH